MAHRGFRKVLMHLTDMMSLYPGDRDVLVYLPGQKPIRCAADNRISMTDDLRARLVKFLGEENVKG
jgi:LSD1 subclass zinc finger protein